MVVWTGAAKTPQRQSWRGLVEETGAVTVLVRRWICSVRLRIRSNLATLGPSKSTVPRSSRPHLTRKEIYCAPPAPCAAVRRSRGNYLWLTRPRPRRPERRRLQHRYFFDPSGPFRNLISPLNRKSYNDPRNFCSPGKFPPRS